MPEEIWAESEAYVYYDEPGKLGDTIHFRCPTGKMLSFDDDGFRAGDDLYTIRCDTIGDWKVG